MKQWYHIATDTESKNPRVSRTCNRRMMLFSKFAVANSKKSRIVKEQEASGLSNQLEVVGYCSKIPLLDDILF